MQTIAVPKTGAATLNRLFRIFRIFRIFGVFWILWIGRVARLSRIFGVILSIVVGIIRLRYHGFARIVIVRVDFAARMKREHREQSNDRKSAPQWTNSMERTNAHKLCSYELFGPYVLRRRKCRRSPPTIQVSIQGHPVFPSALHWHPASSAPCGFGRLSSHWQSEPQPFSPSQASPASSSMIPSPQYDASP